MTPAGRAGRASGVARSAQRAVRRAPLTVALVAVVWAYGIATRSLPDGPSPRLLGRIGTGVGPLAEGRWWTPFTAMLWWGDLAGYVVTTALLLLGGVLAERRIGPARTAALLIGTQVLGTLAALGVIAAGAALGGGWATDLAGEVTVGAAAGAVGLAMATSSRLGALWRRRLRLLLLATALMLVGYSGELPDVLLLAACLAGLAAGPVVAGHAARRPGPASRNETRVLVALVVAASAVGPIVAAIAQAPIGPLSVLQFVVLSPAPDAGTVQQICAAAGPDCRLLQARLRLSGPGPGIASVVPVLLLLVVAEGLRRGRRAAWAVGIALNLVLAALGVLLAALVTTTPDEQLVVYRAAPGARALLALVLPPLLPLAVAALLWLTRDRFAVAAPAGTYRRLAIIAGATLVATGAGYVLGGTLVADQFDRPPTAAALVRDLPSRFLPPGYLGEVEPGFLPQGLAATVLFEWTGVVFWLVVTAGLLRTFLLARLDATPDVDRARALARAGGSNLSWLSTWAGNSYWFAADEPGAAVAYRVIGSVAVTTADPIGRAPPSGVVAGFAGFCARRGWTPAFYSVTDATRAACAELGWSWVQVAEETVLPLPGLTFTGKKWQDVRTALNKARRSGITAEWISYAHAPLAVTDQIRAISEEWVADKGLPEMGFTLGGLDELADDAVRCLVAVDTDRTVHGVTSWLPVHRDGVVVGWTLDFMRRRENGFRGVMEFLIASAAQEFRDEGAEHLSLSGAPLARVDRGDRPDALQRFLDLVGRSLEPVYGFGSLLAFKAKFQPEYRPLFLAYPDPAALPSIGLAVARAYLPDLTARQSARLAGMLRS